MMATAKRRLSDDHYVPSPSRDDKHYSKSTDTDRRHRNTRTDNLALSSRYTSTNGVSIELFSGLMAMVFKPAGSLFFPGKITDAWALAVHSRAACTPGKEIANVSLSVRRTG
eukprot:scaffold57037_cov30-Prasinocladus_malaysianus.AAC.2